MRHSFNETATLPSKLIDQTWIKNFARSKRFQRADPGGQGDSLIRLCHYRVENRPNCKGRWLVQSKAMLHVHDWRELLCLLAGQVSCMRTSRSNRTIRMIRVVLAKLSMATPPPRRWSRSRHGVQGFKGTYHLPSTGKPSRSAPKLWAL